MLRPTRVQISRSALVNNLTRLKTWTGANFFCPMVKANAYGHDEVLVAREVEKFGADAAGVSLIEEGMRLRQEGLRLPLLVFGPFDADGARAMHEHGLTPVVGRQKDLEALAEAGLPMSVHLKFNTGMQRMGFDPVEIPQVERFLRDIPFVTVTGVCTHLTHGDDIDSAAGPSARQMQAFLELAATFPKALRHAHKSASLGVLKERIASAAIGARPGIALYGLPDGGVLGPGLVPALSWLTELTHFHVVEKNVPVGYGARWVAPRRSVIGVVPVGYGDGYSRALSNKGEMLFRGRRVPVVGSVCMDYTLLDLTAATHDGDPQPGESVTLIGRQGGQQVTAAELAEKAGTIAYEIVTAISRRVPREGV